LGWRSGDFTLRPELIFKDKEKNERRKAEREKRKEKTGRGKTRGEMNTL
jgi:hypothetical protein